MSRLASLVQAPVSACAHAAPHWYTSDVHVRTRRAALIHVRCPHAHPPRRMGTRPVSPCAHDAPHWYTSGVPMRTRRAALVHVRRPRAHTTRRIGTRPYRTCVHAGIQMSDPLDILSLQMQIADYNGENRKIFDVGGCRRYGRAGEHIRSVPVRELSVLLLPRALGVCTRLGQSSTGSTGAWPRLPAGGRLALVDES